ncbi:ComF family protein [Butyrivibrio sp. YAB3001]|uniref:ComF family protein n=1 Tax=Butyrivibrio sp. YAB3001 TaxID=1520812 RepID=UPI0008F62E80|nr:ComF family protein [Butyrivibrio sp. YAB3001]SFC18142.1 comF family protein [Butyrivibrio sp. YAB3001]
MDLQEIKETGIEIFDKTLDLVYPRHCPVCDEIVSAISFGWDGVVTGQLIHDKCRKKIRYIHGNTCLKCGKLLPDSESDNEYCRDCYKTKHVFDRGFSIFEYRSISGAIYRFKYSGRQEYARFFAGEAKKLCGARLKKLGIEAIVPVPMFKGKEKKRGYNQAEIFAKELSLALKIPMRNDIIERNRNTRPMKELDVCGRRNNLKKAFNITQNDVKFKCILIIDDIYTTGSTIDEIAHEFRITGVKRIYFLTLAIGQTT